MLFCKPQITSEKECTVLKNLLQQTKYNNIKIALKYSKIKISLFYCCQTHFLQSSMHLLSGKHAILFFVHTQALFDEVRRFILTFFEI